MTRRLPWTSLLLFVALAYAITWLAWLPGILQHKSIFSVSMPLTLLGGFGPAIAAVLTAALTEGRPGVQWLGRRLVAWRVPLRWYAVALLLPLTIGVGAMAVAMLRTGQFPGFRAPAGDGTGAMILTVLTAFLIQMLLTGGNEELGWRGFALPGLQAKMGALPATLVLAGIWAVWHWPLFVMVGTSHATIPFWFFLLFTFPLTTLFTWVHNGSGGSVLLVMILHGAVNATAEYLKIGMLSTNMLLVWAVMAVVIVAAGWRKWMDRRLPEAPVDRAA
ncbi:MAG TPA: CPBP family intramembrane glutamic endopeptidase [Symbiobacteriaceae bacterium]|nr:CPBP family intramembrane glutamic endopeptidase [Symbiobacteriaceae bacterium]